MKIGKLAPALLLTAAMGASLAASPVSAQTTHASYFCTNHPKASQCQKPTQATTSSGAITSVKGSPSVQQLPATGGAQPASPLGFGGLLAAFGLMLTCFALRRVRS